MDSHVLSEGVANMYLGLALCYQDAGFVILGGRYDQAGFDSSWAEPLE